MTQPSECEDDGVEDAGVEDEDDVELEVATARALVVARIIVLVIIIPHRLDAPRRSAAVVIALVVSVADAAASPTRLFDQSARGTARRTAIVAVRSR